MNPIEQLELTPAPDDSTDLSVHDNEIETLKLKVSDLQYNTQKLRHLLSQCKEAIAWTGGSPSFVPSGTSHSMWVQICLSVMREIDRILEAKPTIKSQVWLDDNHVVRGIDGPFVKTERIVEIEHGDPIYETEVYALVISKMTEKGIPIPPWPQQTPTIAPRGPMSPLIDYVDRISSHMDSPLERHRKDAEIQYLREIVNRYNHI